VKAPLKAIRVLSDGRPGHENQSLGLAEALARRTGAAVRTVRLPLDRPLWTRISAARKLEDGETPPQLLIAAGHRTHLPLYFAARRFHARSVVIMKPSLPARLFDLCLVPRHDLRNPRDRGHILVTRGALNRIAETPAEKTATGLILVGGPSKHHGWSLPPLLDAIAEAVRSRPELAWTLTNSRRTPPEFAEALGALDLPLEFAPVETTGPGWLPARLLTAREAWVTEDSASMVFEALTAGARVGLLPLPRLRPDSRVLRAIEDLVDSGYVRTLAGWRDAGHLLPEAPALHETARCAEAIINKFFQHVDS
jgi:uncharacterized protein